MPDDRNWFATVGERCDECGYDAAAPALADLPDAVRELGPTWSGGLPPSTAGLRARRDETTWSALEYAGHTRDVLSVFAGRIAVTLTEDEPELGWWDHEAAAVEDAYNDQDPHEVLAALAINADRLASVLAAVPDGAWGRIGTRRGYERFTIEAMARFCLHEGHHHLADAQRSAARSGSRDLQSGLRPPTGRT